MAVFVVVRFCILTVKRRYTIVYLVEGYQISRNQMDDKMHTVNLYSTEIIELIDCVRVSRNSGTYKRDDVGAEIVYHLEKTLEEVLKG